MSSSALKQDSWAASHDHERKDELIRAMKASTGEGPGRFLRELRELKGLSVMDVASRINLGIAQVKALEEEQYEQLPAPIYVRGYLKRYAEVIDIPVEAVIESWERVGEATPPPLKRVTLREKISNRTVSVRWATYTAFALFVFLVFLWSRTIEQTATTAVDTKIVDVFPPSETGASALTAEPSDPASTGSTPTPVFSPAPKAEIPLALPVPPTPSVATKP
jgi:cytoskeleton protein RodZ